MTVPIELLSFIPTGASNKRGLGDWASDFYYNVKNFKCDDGQPVKGDGSHDDTTGIQHCFDAAFGSSGSPHGVNSQLNVPVFFPPGQYQCNNLTLTQVLGGKIRGETATLQFNGSNTGTNCILRTNGLKNSTIEGIQFQGFCPIGVDFDWTGTGSVGLSGNTLSCGFSNGTVGFQIGTSGHEGHGNFLNMGGSNCDYAIKIISSQAHANWLVGGGAGCNVAAIWVQGGSLVFVNSNMSLNPIDFIWDSSGTLVELGGRTESPGTHLKISAGRALIQGLIMQPGSGTNYFVDASGSAIVVLDTVSADSTVSIKGTGGTLYLRGGTGFANASFLSGFSGVVREFIIAPIAFTNLPPAVEGCQANITDCNTATWGATVAGGGSNHTLVRYNGTAWTVVGK